MADSIHNTQNILETEIEKRTLQLSDAKNMLEISLAHERLGRETQANLMALMAHEMRNPVAVISYTTQTLGMLARSDQPDWLPRIEKIRLSTKQLADLMDNFLSEKWLSMDQHGLIRERGDLNQICAGVIDDFTKTRLRTIRFDAQTEDTCICADWPLVRIAIVNLLDNASKYSSAENEIRLTIVTHKQDWLGIEVCDQGSGIPAELQPRIFEKFIRGRHESDIPGSGLGLYLVNWIARFHGGYTEVTSTEGRGSTFRLWLPIQEPVA
jgi:signal transduction histidine kinase